MDERVSAHLQKLCPLKLLRFVARAAVHFVYTPHPSCPPQKQNADAYPYKYTMASVASTWASPPTRTPLIENLVSGVGKSSMQRLCELDG